MGEICNGFSFKMVIACIGGMITGALGGWDMALRALCLFVVFDYITGLSAAYCEKKLNSEVGAKGIVKKICLFVPIGVCYWLDSLTGQDFLRSIAIFFYIANEGISVIENLGRMGVPVPPFIMTALEQLKKKSDGQD